MNTDGMTVSSFRLRSASVVLLFVLGLLMPSGATAQSEKDDDQLRVTDLQYINTHNAYHIAPDDAVLSFVRQSRGGGGSIDKELLGHEYTHPTLTKQLAMGVRSFEIDAHDDPSGDRYSKPAVYKNMTQNVVRALPPLDPSNDLAKPGFKTFHQTDFDMRSTCLLFKNCLKEIADWHKANPQHIPIFILLEIKDDEGVKPIAGDPQLVWRRLQGEILSEFSPGELILPSEIEYNPVRWPTLATARGKVVFLLFNYGNKPAERYAKYLSKSGDRALLHVEQNVGALHATWQSHNNPTTIDRTCGDSGPNANSGLLLYTKADTTGIQDTVRSKLAISSPANFVATDFLTPYARRSSYSVSFNGEYVRTVCDRK